MARKNAQQILQIFLFHLSHDHPRRLQCPFDFKSLLHPPTNRFVYSRSNFYFTEIAVSTKVCMILFKRKQIVSIFELLDCDEFKGNDITGSRIVENHNYYYKLYYKSILLVSNFTYLSQVLFPVIGMLIFKTSLDLPICKYYFLTEENKDDYFTLIFVYQSVGMYGHMMYNVNIDPLIVGFMVMAIAQMKVLSHDLENLKIEKIILAAKKNWTSNNCRSFTNALNITRSC